MNAKGQIHNNNNNVFDLQRGHKLISVTSGETQLSSMDLLRPEISSYSGMRWSPAHRPCSGIEMQMAAAGNHEALPRHLGGSRGSTVLLALLAQNRRATMPGRAWVLHPV